MEALIGVIVGGLIGFFSGAGLRLIERQFERRSLRAAIKAELQGILHIEEKRQHEEHFRSYVEAWKRGDKLNEIPTIIEGPEENDVPIYTNHIGRIGDLGPNLAPLVIQFYRMFNGLTIDIRAAARGEFNDKSVEYRIEFFEKDLALWAEAKGLAQKLIDEL